jgi:hypothetical protein
LEQIIYHMLLQTHSEGKPRITTFWPNVTLRACGYSRGVFKQVRETIDQAWLIVQIHTCYCLFLVIAPENLGYV